MKIKFMILTYLLGSLVACSNMGTRIPTVTYSTQSGFMASDPANSALPPHMYPQPSQIISPDGGKSYIMVPARR